MDDPGGNVTERTWDEEIVSLLSEFSHVQQELLDHLNLKRELLVRGDAQGLLAHHDQELALAGRLQACHDRRGRLLAEATREGLPGGSLAQLSSALPGDVHQAALPIFTKASNQARLLRHHSLTNWVLAQRSLLHVSYLIEILINGSKLRPTYGKGDAQSASGVLVDHAA